MGDFQQKSDAPWYCSLKSYTSRTRNGELLDSRATCSLVLALYDRGMKSAPRNFNPLRSLPQWKIVRGSISIPNIVPWFYSQSVSSINGKRAIKCLAEGLNGGKWRTKKHCTWKAHVAANTPGMTNNWNFCSDNPHAFHTFLPFKHSTEIITGHGARTSINCGVKTASKRQARMQMFLRCQARRARWLISRNFRSVSY